MDLPPWVLTPFAPMDVVLIPTDVSPTHKITPIVKSKLDRLTVKPTELARLVPLMPTVVFSMVVDSPDNPSVNPTELADLVKLMPIVLLKFLIAVLMEAVTIAEIWVSNAELRMVVRLITNKTATAETVFVPTSVLPMITAEDSNVLPIVTLKRVVV